MIIRHITPQGEVSGEPTGFSASFLRGKRDWFSQFNLGRATRYEGWFLTDEADQPHQYWKFLERIDLFPTKPQLPDVVTVKDQAVMYVYPDGTEVTMQLVTDLGSAGGMCVQASTPVELELFLDMRGIYLQPTEGRSYTVTHERGGYLVSYTDPLLNGRVLYLSVQSPEKITTPESPIWKEVHYGRDARRNSEPSTLWIGRLGSMTVTNLTLGIGFTADQARAGAKAASRLPNADFSAVQQTDSQTASRYLAEKSLQALHVSSGYYAGFPWFHQHWSRDELLTALGLPFPEQLKLLDRYLETSLYQGELPTYTGSGTYCSDGVGWLALLVREMGIENLDDATKAKLTTFFQGAVSSLDQYRKTPTGLIWSGHNATWMDTIGRVGCPIEVQTMYGLCLQLLHTLTGMSSFEETRQKHLETTRHALHHELLHDGLNADLSLNTQLRPNVFLAYLIQPDLLQAEGWYATFDAILTHCRAPWGGITSLNWEDPLFQAQSTGENNVSYHQGDSWFHINCLAAIALKRLNRDRYGKTIDELTESTCRELLWQHYMGAPGEIASAESGASWGCGIQGFAAGPLVKLLTELRN